VAASSAVPTFVGTSLGMGVPLCWLVIVEKSLFAAELMKAPVIDQQQDLSLLAFAGANSHRKENQEDRLIARPGVDQCRQKDVS
jgi:hypothetical protein